MEHLYSTGELVIHHKQGARKFYALARDYVSGDLLVASDPLPDDCERIKWRMLRRISAAGLLWNRTSDTWLNIWGMKSPERNKGFEELLTAGKILKIQVEGIADSLYCNAKGPDFCKSGLFYFVRDMRFSGQSELLCINANHVYQSAVAVNQIRALREAHLFPKGVAIFVVGKSNQIDFVDTFCF